MWLLAVNLGLQIGASDLYVQNTKQEASIWDVVKPSIVYLKKSGQVIGAGAFISEDGYIVAHQLTTTKQPDEGESTDGRRFGLQFVTRDAPSQLDLLRVKGKFSGFRPVGSATPKDLVNGTVLAVLSNTPTQVELTSGEKWGIDQKTKRGVPMQAVRCEQASAIMGGALLFSANGKLIGSIAATLAESSSAQMKSNDLVQRAQTQNQGFSSFNNSRNYGPQGLVVAYTPTWEVTAKAISGFLSPNHVAEYGVIGVYATEVAGQNGVKVTNLVPASNAMLAGIMPGDVILQIDDTKIKGQVDFFRVIYRLVPGSQIVVQLMRGLEIKTLTVKVGRQVNAAASREFSIERFPLRDSY
jgi:S1-C subfamily serine protease